MILVLAGTFAQIDHGLWFVLEKYFRCFLTQIGPVPFPGGFTLGVALLLNLTAAFIVRFRWTARSAGPLISHAGLILLLAGEAVTALFAVEGNMRIDEGRGTQFIEHARRIELAVIDPSGQTLDQQIVIPGSLLQSAHNTQQVIRDHRLPFDISIHHWFPNSSLAEIAEKKKVSKKFINPATTGAGTAFQAKEHPQATGIGNERNMPSAYITFTRDGTTLGTWLVSLFLRNPQVVVAKGNEYTIALRPERTYKPYTLYLKDFKFDRFTGTQVARNFSSLVQLIDPEQGENREVLIYMNHPLRYRGETFYQASFKSDETGTVLQVVNNPGWLLPYVSCSVMTLGLLWHFLFMLRRFLARREKQRPQRQDVTTSVNAGLSREPTNKGSRIVVALILLAVTGSLARRLTPPKIENPFDLDSFSRIPVSSDGRIKPLDSVARNTLLVLSHKQEIKTGDQTLPAIEWLITLLTDPDQAHLFPVFRIDDPGLLPMLGLKPEEGPRYSFDQIKPKFEELQNQYERANKINPNDRNAYQRSVLKLSQNIILYNRLATLQVPYLVPPLEPGEEWQALGEGSPLVVRKQWHAMLFAYMNRFDVVLSSDGQKKSQVIKTVQKISGKSLEEAEKLVESSLATVKEGVSRAEADQFKADLEAVGSTATIVSKPNHFNEAVNAYKQYLETETDSPISKTSFEVYFSRTQPFIGAIALYVLGFLLFLVSFLSRAMNNSNWSLTLSRCAFWTIVITLFLHTFGLISRIYITGRPPVTNLYSSAIFIGWCAVVFSILLEGLFRIQIAGVTASIIGFVTLIIAHNLSLDGDTMGMMQAVLDSNFWLSTHVITITIGYSGTFLAGLFGGAYVVLGLFTRLMTADLRKSFYQMTYAVVCFALLFSFVGTILGGIWADQSWGRFWGWDPKENGALLIVLWCAFILHARLSGWAQERGFMLLSIFGCVVTAFSWFGTNMLGVGLHSYGFMDSAAWWLITFMGSQIFLILLGLLPTSIWRSLRT
jgi:ABC-type transport system involved in cytochrome c biogenesis permease subunit